MKTIEWRVREIMQERGLSVRRVAKEAGVSRAALEAIWRGDSRGVTFETIEKLCDYFRVDLADLMTLVVNDLWESVRIAREVTIHIGSRALLLPPGGGPPKGYDLAHGTKAAPAGSGHGGDDEGDRAEVLCVAVPDLEAYGIVVERLHEIGAGIRVHLHHHAMDRRGGSAPGMVQAVDQMFAGGNHVFIGSPRANPRAEMVVCRMYGADGYNVSERGRFPYGFVFETEQSVGSSFGWQGLGRAFGIVATDTNEIVASRTLVDRGCVGRDAALIAVLRIEQLAAQRRFPADRVRTIVCLLGHGRLGTRAAAMVATSAEFAERLGRVPVGKPEMFVVSAEYRRSLASMNIDDSAITSARLVDVEPSTNAKVPAVRAEAEKKSTKGSGGSTPGPKRPGRVVKLPVAPATSGRVARRTRPKVNQQKS